MRMRTWSAELIVIATLVMWGSHALADTAVTVDINCDHPDFSIYKYLPDQVTLGWRFFVDKQITITHVGLLDPEGDGLTSTHVMALWRLPNKGGFSDPCFVVEIGPAAVPDVDHHVYVALATPVTLDPNEAGYTLPSGTVNYERWLLGVWSPSGNQDRLVVYPLGAVTENRPDCWHIQVIDGFKSYTYDGDSSSAHNPTPTPSIEPPWGGTVSDRHWAMNFQFAEPGPLAEAGDPCDIYTAQQATTIIDGSATHTVPGTLMDYRWLEGETVLQDWSAVGADGEAPLSLASPVPAMAIGEHTLKLEVTDGALTSSDTMVLTVSNSPPQAELAPATQVVEVGLDVIIIAAGVADFDGDELTYEWRKGGEVLQSGTVTPPAGGDELPIEDLIIPPRDPRFPLGVHEVQLVVSDGVNTPVTVTATVEVKDTRDPTICPIPSRIILWPPDGQLKQVTVWVFVCDNAGGGGVTLSAEVESSRPPLPGQTDWYIDSIDQEHNVIQLRLRAERRLPGVGRVYKITVTATDESGNSSSAIVRILAPRHSFDRPWWWH